MRRIHLLAIALVGIGLYAGYLFLGYTLFWPRTVTSASANLTLADCEAASDQTAQISQSERSALINTINDFAFELYGAVDKIDSENIMLAPYTVSRAMGMAYPGADGETASQIASALKFRLPPDDIGAAFSALDRDLTEREYTERGMDADKIMNVQFANLFWGQENYPWAEDYLTIVNEEFGCGFRKADFASDPEAERVRINDWVNNVSNQRIRELLPPDALDDKVRAVITSVIWFYAGWENEFEKDKTIIETFTTLTGTVQTPLMHFPEFDDGDAPNIPYVRGDGYQAIDLPYHGGDASMLIILPDQGSFDDAEQALSGDFYRQVLNAMHDTEATVILPRFELDYDTSLVSAFERLGIRDAFDPDAADFNPMTTGSDDNRLYIDNIYHSTYVKVDEAGTEATGASAVGLRDISDNFGGPLVFRADRPFIFAIRDRVTGTVLFVGRVVDPTA